MTHLINRKNNVTSSHFAEAAEKYHKDSLKQWDTGAVILSIVAVVSLFNPWSSWDARVEAGSLSMFLPLALMLGAGLMAYVGNLQTRKHGAHESRVLKKVTRITVWASLTVLTVTYLITLLPLLIAL